MDPYYYHIYSSDLPPERSYRLKHPKRDRVTTDISHFKLKGYKKRNLYSGYNNYTELEKEWMVKVKHELRTKHGVDLDLRKPFGPRAPDSTVTEGTQTIVSGADPLWDETMLLKYIVAYKFEMTNIVSNLLYHFEWRQTNVPRPYLMARVIPVMEKGLLYIHGRSMDMSPIIILDFVKLEEMIDAKAIDPPMYCNLWNLLATYM
jgi:hypothetical protein